MQQLTKRHCHGTVDRVDTIAEASEFPSTSDTPSGVQQRTNGLHSSQQATLHQWTPTTTIILASHATGNGAITYKHEHPLDDARGHERFLQFSHKPILIQVHTML